MINIQESRTISDLPSSPSQSTTLGPPKSCDLSASSQWFPGMRWTCPSHSQVTQRNKMLKLAGCFNIMLATNMNGWYPALHQLQSINNLVVSFCGRVFHSDWTQAGNSKSLRERWFAHIRRSLAFAASRSFSCRGHAWKYIAMRISSILEYTFSFTYDGGRSGYTTACINTHSTHMNNTLATYIGHSNLLIGNKMHHPTRFIAQCPGESKDAGAWVCSRLTCSLLVWYLLEFSLPVCG